MYSISGISGNKMVMYIVCLGDVYKILNICGWVWYTPSVESIGGQLDLPVTTTSIIKYITCDLFSNVF